MTDESLRALAYPTRAAIVEALSAEQLCVCHLVEVTGATSSDVSNHLEVLEDGGSVEAEPAGTPTTDSARRCSTPSRRTTPAWRPGPGRRWR